MPARARLYRRGRVYWTWFYVGNRKVCRSTRCRGERAAAVVAARLEREAAEAAASPRLPANETTVRDALDRLLEDRAERERSPATIRFYTQKAGQLMRGLGEATMLVAVDATAMDGYVSLRLAEGASRHTVAKELGTWRAAMRLARRRTPSLPDPATVLPLGWSADYKPRTRWLPRAEVTKLLGELPDRAGHLAFIVATGARLSESERAQRVDWDWKSNPPLCFLRGSKTNAAPRTVPILPHVSGLAKRAYAAAARKGTAYEPWGNVRRDIAAACARAGIDRCSPNDLRRTAGQWLRQLGASPAVIGEFLGHTSGRMVERVYGRLQGVELGRALLQQCSGTVARSRSRSARNARGA